MTIIVMVQKVEDLLGQETSPLHHIEKHTILGFSESGPSWTQAPETLIFGKKLDLLVNSGRFAAYAPPLPWPGVKGFIFITIALPIEKLHISAINLTMFQPNHSPIEIPLNTTD